jgi:hypothetical protein
LFERQFVAALQDYARSEERFDHVAIAHRAAAHGSLRRLSMPWRPSLSVTLAGLTIVAAFGLYLGGVRPDIGGQPTPSSRPTPTYTVMRTSAPTPTVITWESADAQADWPGPLRDEPSSTPLLVRDNAFVDDDGRVVASPVVDVARVETWECGWFEPSVCIGYEIADGPARPLPEPDETWVAYGIVADVDSDGIADFRYGIDNAAGHGNGVGGPEDTQRMWRTDLRTGETLAWLDTLEHPPVMDAVLPGDPIGYPGNREGVENGHIFAHATGPIGFYVWAAVIADGEVRALDFAPNSGWLEAIP